MNEKLYKEVYEVLSCCPKIDIHTHLTANRLMARGLDDILLYHMVNSELYSAGCSQGERVPEDPSEEEVERRIIQALPCVNKIKNTSLNWALRGILHDLYDWNDEITQKNWKKLHHRIKEYNSQDGVRARDIMKKCNIKKIGTEISRRGDGRADDIFEYALEWAFFARTQWGQPDIALFELERAWNAHEPQKPVPVTLKAESRPQFAKKIKTVEDIKRAVVRYCSLIPYADVRATAQHFSTDIDYGDYSRDRVQKALDMRGSAGTEEQNIYSSVIMQAFLQELEKHGKEIVFQFSLGAEALPFESGMRLRQQTLAQLADLIYRYPNLHFMCFNASRHCHQSLCTLVRELQNFSLAGFWWHSFFPGAMKQIAEERLDMIPLNRQVGYLTDAYCIDWVYGKNRIILSQYAIVFTEKIQIGQYTIRDIEYIAKNIFYDSPIEILSITE